MVWFCVDDRLHSDERLDVAGDALALWVACGSWSANQLTDGLIPEARVRKLSARRTDSARLVAAGFWLETDGGFQMVDWAPGNRLRSVVLEERARNAERSRAARTGARMPARSPVVPEGNGKSFSRAEPPNLQQVTAVDPDDVPAYLAVLRGGSV